MDRRFVAAMLIYAVLIALAIFTLSGSIRLATLLLLGLFVAKTVLVVLRRRLD